MSSLRKTLHPGTRIRLRTHPDGGWRAEGTIVEVGSRTAVALMDGYGANQDTFNLLEWHEGEMEAPHGDWAILRDQAPNEDHAAALPPTYH
jgi:hypothetical protein